jgi:hypothetical protein
MLEPVLLILLGVGIDRITSKHKTQCERTKL